MTSWQSLQDSYRKIIDKLGWPGVVLAIMIIIFLATFMTGVTSKLLSLFVNFVWPMPHTNILFVNQQNLIYNRHYIYLYNDGNTTEKNFSFKVGLQNLSIINFGWGKIGTDSNYDNGVNITYTEGYEQNPSIGNGFIQFTIKNLSKHQYTVLWINTNKSYGVYEVTSKNYCTSDLNVTFSNLIHPNISTVEIEANYADIGTCDIPSWIGFSTRVPLPGYPTRNFSLNLTPGQNRALYFNVTNASKI